MANEITLATQQVVYGGPDISSLIASSVATKFKSIQVLGGQAWGTYLDGRQDFLNTLKTLKKGDIVLLVAKTLPADFPVLTTAVQSAYPQNFSFEGADGETVTEFVETTHLGESFKVDTTSIKFTLGAGTVEFRLNGGSYGTAAALNAAILASSSPYRIQTRVTHAGACAFNYDLLAATA